MGQTPTPNDPRGGGGSGAAQGTRWAAAGRRVGPAADGARVEGTRAPVWTAVAARVRRCVSTWSMTDDGVMNATRRITPWQDGHARGSTSKICCRSAAVGLMPAGGWPRLAPASAQG